MSTPIWKQRRAIVFLGLLGALVLALSLVAIWLPGRVLAWATAFEAGVLVVAALYAGRQLTELRETRLAQSRPYVIAYLRHQPVGHTLIDFVIANLGKTVARDITLSFDPPLSPTSGPQVSFEEAHWAVFESGLPMLAPGQELSCLWAHSLTIFKTDAEIPKKHTVEVSYRGDYPKGSSYNGEEYVLDVGAFEGRMSVAAKGADEIARALEAISGSLKGWSEGDGVRVYLAGIEEEIQELIERHNAQTGPPENTPSD